MRRYEIERRRLADNSLLVELRGDFDRYSLDELQRSLSVAVSFRRQVYVDVSGVTLADVSTLRELAAYYRLYSHHLTLCNPSWQLLRSAEACGFPAGPTPDLELSRGEHEGLHESLALSHELLR